MTRIILTRHGQTEWNLHKRFRGRADIPLNDTGIIRADLTSKRIHASWQPAAVYTSPLSRAVRTAEAIAVPAGLNNQPLESLNDIDYGDWQGLTAEEVRERWNDQLDIWYRTPHLARIPGGESLQDLFARTSNALSGILRQDDSETIVLVGHDSVNRALLLFMLGLPLSAYWRLVQGNCAINVISFADHQFTVESINETWHLSCW